MWCLHPCNRERPLPKPAEAKLNGSAWLALGLPAFLAGKMKDEYGKGGWMERVSSEANWSTQPLGYQILSLKNRNHFSVVQILSQE